MARLTTATGVTANVADDKAPGLIAVGYKASDEKKAPAKKASSSKSSK